MSGARSTAAGLQPSPCHHLDHPANQHTSPLPSTFVPQGVRPTVDPVVGNTPIPLLKALLLTRHILHCHRHYPDNFSNELLNLFQVPLKCVEVIYLK